MPHYPAGSGRRPKPTMLEPILIVAIVITATAWYVQHKWRKRLRALAKIFGPILSTPTPQIDSVVAARKCLANFAAKFSKYADPLRAKAMSALPPIADIPRRNLNVRFGPILLQKSAMTGAWRPARTSLSSRLPSTP